MGEQGGELDTQDDGVRAGARANYTTTIPMWGGPSRAHGAGGSIYYYMRCRNAVVAYGRWVTTACGEGGGARSWHRRQCGRGACRVPRPRRRR